MFGLDPTPPSLIDTAFTALFFFFLILRGYLVSLKTYI